MIRENGVMNGKITANKPTESDRAEAGNYSVDNPIAAVSQRTITTLGEGAGKRRVALMDYGAKRGIANAFVARGCEVVIFPHDTPAAEILCRNPGGVVLSNGPGDPADPANGVIIETIRALFENGVPIFGICMGHQLMALAKGYKTRKLKFGHRGTNQPVKDTRTGRVYITSQNHGYEVVTADCSMVNVNDNSCEGLDYGTSFSVQFHPEACGGPLDTAFLFEQFIERMDSYAAR